MTTKITLGQLVENLKPHGLTVIKIEDLEKLKQDFYLHKYQSYEEYRDVQIFFNKQKIDKVWADQQTLDIVINRLKQEFKKNKINGLCHGTRNGFEQNYLADKLKSDVLGTDISDTATAFPRSVQWDFHDENAEWLESNDFVYTNSLDQSWQPKTACTTWLNQLRQGGLLFIEHTTEGHSPAAAGRMDPFGAKPAYMPYLITEWFGHNVSVEIIKSKKSNWCATDIEVYLFVIKKLVNVKFKAD